MPCVSIVTLPGQVVLGHDESRLSLLHSWIAALCDPFSVLVTELNNTVKPKLNEKCLREDLGSEAETRQLRRRVSHISQSGIRGYEELETLQEEDESEDGEACEVRSHGPVCVRDPETDEVFEGNYEGGTPHGYFRHINGYGDLEFFGCFHRGTLLGVCWKSLPGGGFLVSKSWNFSDPHSLYLYPDCRTGLLGSFNGERLEVAREAEVDNFVTLVHNSIPVPVVSLKRPTEFTWDPASTEVFSRTPHLPDPYEAIFVEVRQSRIKDAGQGLFAKTDIEQGTIISFYNGVKVRSGGDWERPTPYKMFLDETQDIDIPDSMTSLASYSATLGHKVCHSFSPNSESDIFCHPRFGMIRCIATTRAVRAGQEITINYGYNLSIAPTWYKVAWAKHQKVVRGLPDWRTALRLNNMSLGSRRASWLSDYNSSD